MQWRIGKSSNILTKFNKEKFGKHVMTHYLSSGNYPGGLS